MKLTRKQIAEGLKTQPIEKLLLGNEAKTTSLTAKQKAFAEKVAEGETKAQAYRDSYETNGNKDTEAREAHRLSLNPKIATMIEQLKLSKTASEYLLPQHLRSLIVQKLTEKALDDDIKTSDQLRAIELLGKLTDVSAFTERKEIVKQSDSNEARAKLINAITNAIKTTNTLTDDKRASAESLLNEIANARQPITIEAEPTPQENSAAADPPPATPPFEPLQHEHDMHTISDNQSPENDGGTPTENVDEVEEDNWWE
jgi:hypothetical protein